MRNDNLTRQSSCAFIRIPTIYAFVCGQNNFDQTNM